MATKISDVMIISIIIISVFLGMMSIMNDLDDNYPLTVPEESEDYMNEISGDINKSSTDLQSSLTGDQSWLETTFNIVFRVPQTIMSGINGIINSADELSSLTTGEDMPAIIPVPPWVSVLISSILAIIVITTLVYLIFGRGF